MKLLAFCAVMSLSVVSALAQSQPSKQHDDPQKHMTNCTQPGAASKGSDGQAVEKSAIVPSTGQSESSAAPTVQRDGKSAEVSSNCPQDPGMPKPGTPKS